MSMFLQKILELYAVTGSEGLGLGFLRQEEGWKSEFTLRDHFSTALRASSKSKIASTFFPGVLKAAVSLISSYDSNLWKNW